MHLREMLANNAERIANSLNSEGLSDTIHVRVFYTNRMSILSMSSLNNALKDFWIGFALIPVTLF